MKPSLRPILPTLAVLILPFSSFADTQVVDGIEWTYTVSDGKASIGGGSRSSTAVPQSTAGAVAIPSTLGSCPVTSIGFYAFYNCSGLTSITIPDSVTSIESYAFYYCTGLVSIEIPDGVTSIPYWAFSDCYQLASITIPDSVTTIAGGVFRGCSKLTSITIPDNVTSIGSSAFYNCSGLTSITIPDGVTSIGNEAFTGCSGLTAVTADPKWGTRFSSATNFAFTIPNGVTSIGQSAFSGCPDILFNTNVIRGLKLVDGWVVGYTDSLSGNLDLTEVRGIADYAFSGCSGLTSITIPDGVTNIGSYAFYNCSGLTSITIPSGVTSIGQYAFYNCSGLTSITIPDSVTSIGQYAFYYCTGLVSIEIPDGVTSIPYWAFSDCYELASITIPDSVTTIAGGVFRGCGKLTSITIPEGVTSIGSDAFYNCSGLTSITIPDSVTSIGSNAFYGCSGLMSIAIPDSVTSIGECAFYRCSGLTSITIPGSVTSIGRSAFDGCSGLTSVTADPKWGTEFSSATNFVFVIPAGVTSIGRSAFSGCSGLTSITIPDSVTSIGGNAFSGCSRLTSITIPDSVTRIGQSAFSGCSGLTSITIPDSVTSIGEYAFSGCPDILFNTNVICGLKLVHGWVVGYTDSLSGNLDLTGVRGIADSAFSGCSGLTSITIPDSVTSIGDSAFRGCSGLTAVTADPKWGTRFSSATNFSFTIPNGVTSIGQSAFSGCSGLTSVTIQDSVTSIGSSAFSGCSGLTSITIPDSVTSIGTSAFSGCTGLKAVYVPVSYSGNMDIGTSIIVRYAPTQTLNLDASGGSIDQSEFSFSFGDDYGVLPGAYKEDFVFVGWATSPGGLVVFHMGDSIKDCFESITVESTTLYARWSQGEKSSICFDANGGRGQMIEQDLWHDISDKLYANRFSKDGHFFLGWARTPDGEAVLLDGDSTDEVEAEAGETVTLYAVWRERKPGLIARYYDIASISDSSWFQQVDSYEECMAYHASMTPTIVTNTANLGTTLDFGMDETCRFHGKYASRDSDYFVMVLEGNMAVGDSGTYSFKIRHDDGCVVYLDRTCVYSSTYKNYNAWYSFSADISSGAHELVIAFHEYNGGHGLQFQIMRPSDNAYVDLPQSMLSNQDIYAVRFDANGGTIVSKPRGLLVKYYDISSSDYSTWSASETAFTNYFASRTPTIVANTIAFGESLDSGIAGIDSSSVNQFCSWGLNDLRFEADGTTNRFHGKYAQKSQDNISAYLTGFIEVSDPGTYSFACIADDYEAIFIDGVRVCRSQWNTIGYGSVALEKGVHSFSMGFHEGDGGHGFAVQWKKPGDTAWSPLPQSVLFHPDDISVVKDATSFKRVYTCGDDIDLPTGKRIGYTLSGWSTVPDRTVLLPAIETLAGGIAANNGETIDLSAVWTPNEYTATFNASGTPGSPSTKTVTFDSSYGELPTPTRPGYTFSNWLLYGDVVTAETICTTPSNHVLTAAWTPNDYTVSFDAKGGMVNPVSKGVMFDAAYGALPTPVREPYVFVDWRLGGATVDPATIVTTPSNHVLSARWGVSIGGGVWEETICDEPISLGAPLVAPSGRMVVPAEIDGRPVVEIGAEAFAGNTTITSVTIPASVTNIADGAFAGCTGLKTVAVDSLRDDRFAAFLPDLAETVERVVFLDGVTAIPDNFFEGCTALRSMDIAESVVEIGTNVFEACSALETTVVDGLEMYQGWVLGFSGGSLGALAPPDLAIPAEYEEADGSGSRPYQVRGIAAGAFEGEFGIGTVSLPESLRFVGERAFKDCTSLESIAVPEGVAKIDREAFRNCTYAQGLALPGTLREIGDGAFANAAMLMGATIPDGVVSVGECAFSNCWRMLSVAIPQSVERVGDGAFADCRRVAGVTVPLHVRPMSDLFPAAYSNLATIAVAATDGSLGELAPPEAEAWLASRQMVPEVFKGCAALEGIELPEWVRNVSDGALEGCSAIASLELPDAVTNIGSRACAGMAALESVALPASLVSIGDEAFDGDAGLAALHLPEGLRTIGERAFRGLVPLARAEIPGSVRAIGDGAFAGCASIRAVSIPGDAGTVAAAFPDCYANIVSATVVAEDGGALGERALPTLMDELFEGCAALTSVELPTELAEIGAEAFADCTSLAAIGLPAAVTNLGERAFAGCGTLSSIALPKSLEELKDGTFAGCAAIAEVIVPESVRRFGNGIFDGCTLLRSVRFVGNAPDYGTADGGPYAGVPAGAKSYVANGSKGWDGIATSMALPEYWPADTTYEIAFWTPNRCAVSFDANYEGAGEPAEVEQVTGTSYVLPPNPVRLGARFDGWWTAPENGARITASTQVTATRPHTFYAHWTMNRYYVHFDASGGSGTAEPVEMTVGTPAALPPCPFAKVAHDFAGWATEPGGEVVYADGAQVADLAYAQNAAVTLYAVWRSRDWTLADYLDAPALSFGTAGGGEWGPDWDDAKAGGVSLRCDGLPPAAGGGTVEATLRATVVGAGTLSFWWKTSCEEMDEEYGDWFDYAAFSVDGAETAKIAGESGWRKVECAVEGAGEHGLVWAFVRDDYDEDGADWENALWVDGVEWTPAPVTLSFDAGGATEGATPAAVVKYEGYALALPGPGTLADPPRVFAGWTDGESVYAAGATYVFGSADAVLTAVWTLQTWTLAEAVDAPALVFATGGDADWAVDATAGWTNGVSAKSGSVTNSQASWIETTVSGAGTLSFRWKVLGGIYRNNPFAYAKAEVDGTPASSTHLTDGWEAQALDIVGAGPHTIRWTYLRTSARDCDGDRAWLDGVAWTPAGAPDIVVEGVSIPIAWLDEAAASIVAANGGDFAAAARATAANGANAVWQCYVAGLDPTNATSRLLATIEMENGEPVVTWTPDLNEGGTKSLRVYTVEGKEKLADPTWGPTNEATRFFRVKVEMP